MNTIELIKNIQLRPGMFFGRNSIFSLKGFLDGYQYTMGTVLNNEDSTLRKFQNWVQEKYKIKSSQSWAEIIFFFSTDEKTAMEDFFKLFNEFLNETDSI